MIRGIYIFSEFFTRFVFLSTNWFIINFPIWIILFNISIADTSEIPSLIAAILIIIPFLSFPSTLAAFSVVRKWIIENEYERPIYSFYNQIKQHFKIGMIAGFLVSIITGVLILDLWYFHRNAPLLFLFFLLLSVFYVGYVFALLVSIVHYDLTYRKYFTKALLLMLNLKFTIITISLTSMLFMINHYLGVLVTFMVISVYFYLIFAMFYRTYLNSKLIVNR